MYQHHPYFDGHVLVTSRYQGAAGLSAIIAVHNESRGPAIGGCRFFPYVSFDAAVNDALRLSRGMTYKAAIADIPYGGGKAVIIGDPRTEKSQGALHAMGEFVDSLKGRYITSFDSGTTLADVDTMGERTDFVAGTLPEAGNASASTAAGIYHCMRAAAECRFGDPDLYGVRIAIQGVGNVGRRLAAFLAADGAKLLIADVDTTLAEDVAGQSRGLCVAPDAIMAADADIFAPCAMGAVLSADVIGRLKAKVIVGGANNQLATPEDAARLHAADILYCPDYLANAGGIIDLHYQRAGWSADAVDRHVRALSDTFREVVDRSRSLNRSSAAIADAMAEERFRRNDCVAA